MLQITPILKKLYPCYLLYVFIVINYELWEQIISHFYLKYYQLIPKSLIEKCKKIGGISRLVALYD